MTWIANVWEQMSDSKAARRKSPYTLKIWLVDICSLTICFPPLATETFGFFHESFQLACSWDLYSWDINSWPNDFRPFFRLAFYNCFWDICYPLFRFSSQNLFWQSLAQPLLMYKKLSETFAIWDNYYILWNKTVRSIKIMGKWYSTGKSFNFSKFFSILI